MKITKKTIFAIVEAALFITAIFMLFAPAVRYSNEFMGVKVTEEISCFQMAFGSDDKGTKFAFVAFLSFLFLVAGAVLACLKIFVIKDAKAQKIVNIVILVLGIVAGIFYFCSKTGLMANLDGVDASDVADMLKEWNLGVGAIFAAILAIAAGAVACVDEFVVKE